MIFSVNHETRYERTSPFKQSVQQLHLTPRTYKGQKIINWKIELEGAKKILDTIDHHGNCVQITEQTERSEEIIITACGQVETENMLGVFGSHDNLLPIALYRRVTNYCEVGPTLKRMVSCIELKSDKLEFLHYLSSYVAKSVVYKIGTTDAATTAEESASLGTGVCQDHVHIFLTLARHFDIAARYVSGYLMTSESDANMVSHAWAEAHVEGLGWVGFDISNGVSPGDNYIRLASGFDYTDVKPIAGLSYGDGGEKMTTKVIVQ